MPTRTRSNKSRLFRKTRRNKSNQAGGSRGELPLGLCLGAPQPTVSQKVSNFINPWENTESDMLYINIVLSEESPISRLITRIRGIPLYNNPHKHYCERPHLTLLAVNIPVSAERNSLHQILSDPVFLAHLGRQILYFLHLYIMDPPYRVLTSPSSTYDEFGKFIAKEYTKFPTLNYMLFKNAVVHTLSRFVEEDISNIVQCYPPIFRTAPPLVDHYILGSPYNSAFAISHFYGALHTPHISLYEKPLDAERERLYTDKARLDADKARLDAYTARFDAIDEHEKRVLDNLEISPRTFDTLFISFGKQSLVNIPIGSNINNIGHNNIDSLYTMDTMAKASFVEGAVAALKAVALAAVIAMSTSSGVSDKVHD